MNILVLCTGNSARSILLECILNQAGAGRVQAWSAGSAPSGRVHPQSLRVLDEFGYAADGLSSQSWDVYAAPDAPKMDVIITVCDSANAETCPIWPMVGDNPPVQVHWGIPDPAAASEPDWPQAFQAAYDRLTIKANAMLAMRLEDMSKPDLKSALSAIADL